MLKKSFFGCNQPRFEYTVAGNIPPEPVHIPLPEKVTLHFRGALCGEALVKTGDKVKTGQKLLLCEGGSDYVISSVTGTVSSVTPVTGDFGAAFTAVTIRCDAEETFDESFAEEIAEKGEAEAVRTFLAGVPGGLPAEIFDSPAKHIDTIVICGVEKDLFLTGNQFVMSSEAGAINKGISILKKTAGVHKAVIALYEDSVPKAGALGGASGVELRVIDTAYPSALPRIIMKDVMGQIVPAGQSCEDAGVCFVSAQAVASLGKAFLEKRIPVSKILTLVKKDLSTVTVKARIGTPLADIFRAFDISLFDKDRIILGGPMTGSAVYSTDYPIGPDTDGLMVQDHGEVALVSDYPCINCGECVRICPADVPVNMLVRFLEAKKYEEAADEYDLLSCVECGLCSFVCVSKMPIFQYIRLAKYELSRMPAEEEEEADV
ncbi:MAG: 4Fe-4S dicluster domain-containing protein [Desulfococcaceae bacterium]|jgi:electron transport complex protein RnfC|nr:4Fe-4S dicluster domain-containing protein [Desulfococcaceae bacterium]